jgi:hypothetical protein
MKSRGEEGTFVCAYCSKSIQGSAEVEHVFPESWYPDGTDSTLPRPKVPSCASCNRAYGRVEERLLRTLGLCLRRGVPGTRGIPERALRAASAKKARSPRDRYYREKVRRALMSSVSFVPLDTPGDMPGIKPDLVEKWGWNQSGIYVKGSPALPFPKEDLDTFTKKLVRGLFYLGAEAISMPQEAIIKPFIVKGSFWPECGRMIEQFEMVPRGGTAWLHLLGPHCLPSGLDIAVVLSDLEHLLHPSSGLPPGRGTRMGLG